MKPGVPPALPITTPKIRGDAGAIVVLGTIAALYFAREILIPFAFALTFTFLLTPVVALFQRLHIGRVLSVLTTVLVSIAVAGGIGWLIANQLVDVANQLPLYRQNIHAKIEAFHIPVTGQLGNAAESVQEVVRELTSPGVPSPASRSAQSRSKAAECATCARISRCRSSNPTRGQRMDAASRSGHTHSCASGTGRNGPYLYGLHAAQERRPEKPSSPAGRARSVEPHDASHRRCVRPREPIPADAVPGQCGLWNSVWFRSLLDWRTVCGALGSVAGILRIVPYVGTLVAATLPIALSLAVFDGWLRPLLVFLLFAGLELVVGNFVEPWLYGAHVGISSLALLVAAVFWAVLWGPAGLILSTPLTVCVVVLGRYVPHLSFLHILLGDEPVLAAEAQIYQRLLAMDQLEAHTVVDQFLKGRPLVELYDSVLIPALSMAEQDRHKGAIDTVREEFLFLSINEMIAEFSEYQLPESSSRRRGAS